MYEASFNVRGLVSPVAVETNAIRCKSKNEGKNDLKKISYLLVDVVHCVKDVPTPTRCVEDDTFWATMLLVPECIVLVI